jgi:hypothetical protein
VHNQTVADAHLPFADRYLGFVKFTEPRFIRPSHQPDQPTPD